MIVTDSQDYWDIIFQRNHAVLAGKLALQLQHKYRPPFWMETLSAIIEHDDGQTDWSDGHHLTESGDPKNFTEIDFNLEQARRAVHKARFKSQWITLLISKHTSTLYSDADKPTIALKQFLEEQEALRESLLSHFDMTAEEFETYYQFLRFCDECSLLLCMNQVNTEKRVIGSLGGKGKHFIWQDAYGLHIKPWCFEAPTVSLEAEYFTIPKKPYESAEALIETIQQSAAKQKAWLITEEKTYETIDRS